MLLLPKPWIRIFLLLLIISYNPKNWGTVLILVVDIGISTCFHILTEFALWKFSWNKLFRGFCQKYNVLFWRNLLKNVKYRAFCHFLLFVRCLRHFRYIILTTKLNNKTLNVFNEELFCILGISRRMGSHYCFWYSDFFIIQRVDSKLGQINLIRGNDKMKYSLIYICSVLKD